MAPIGKVTFAGTVADGLVEPIPTLIPPFGAAAFSVTVPVQAAPPATVSASSVNEATEGALIVRLALADEVKNFAVTLATFEAETAWVPIMKDAVVAPPG